ncbi:helix-turn-helix domain-containing protein [Paraflavitalea sp. CAU 1676]|uniref:GlxA family transcriptional regulator n=1 Tax=Paraflavitalea sp. CAU 1676 TaxID=3032598 RepID=UPI0023DBFE81|nr:helix-turn-helix domain-containing protein [Paraflavitalea sp. CAU 1676]MDF2191503.1 DJ-1/PfpI family protein [Paraflavitalea sp. CAU 1676]
MRAGKSLRKKIVLVAMPAAHLIDVAGPGDVFALATKVAAAQLGPGAGGYEIILASATRSKQVVTGSGIPLLCHTRLSDIDYTVDTLLIGGMAFATMHELPPAFFDWLYDHRRAVRRMGSVCVGAFALAKAGLLNNKHATTHWEYCDLLQQDFPQITVDNTPFYVKDGNIYTSGGMTSGMDLALAMVEEDLGRDIAVTVARKLVLHLKRPGSQLQFGNLLPPLELTSDLVKNLQPWLLQRLHKPFSVEDMAAQVNMSVRNFSRVFIKETSLTPAKYLEKMRIDTARRFLSESNLNLEQIALKCGLGGLVSMRRIFLRHLKVTPRFYRSSFRSSLQQEQEADE